MKNLLSRVGRKVTTVKQRYKSRQLLNAAFKSEILRGGV